LATFNREAREKQHRTRADMLIGSPFWVFDPATGMFGPAKFVGFADMSFNKYEDLGSRIRRIGAFHGYLVAANLAQVLRAEFKPDAELAERLPEWAEAVTGRPLSTSTDRSSWRFLRLGDIRKYWAIVIDPKRYDIERAVRELKELAWDVPHYSVLPGDRLAIWRSKGEDGSYGGVVALGEVLSEPRIRNAPDEQDKYWLKAPRQSLELRVKMRLAVPNGLPLWLDEDPAGVALELGQALIDQDVPEIEPELWKRVVSAVGGWPGEKPTNLAVSEERRRKRREERTRRLREERCPSLSLDDEIEQRDRMAERLLSYCQARGLVVAEGGAENRFGSLIIDFRPSEDVLIETSPSNDQAAIRQAVVQLLSDRMHTPRRNYTVAAVLLPEKPSKEELDFVQRLGIRTLWLVEGSDEIAGYWPDSPVRFPDSTISDQRHGIWRLSRGSDGGQL